jgi:hypothetical protein
MVLENHGLDATILVERDSLFVIESASEYVRSGVNMRVHKPGNRACDWRGWWEIAPLRQNYPGRAKDRRYARSASNNEPRFQQLPAVCETSGMVSVVLVITTAEGDNARRVRMATAVGEFPSGQIGESHGIASLRGSRSLSSSLCLIQQGSHRCHCPCGL